MTAGVLAAVRHPARLAALRRLGILDSPAEPSFDRFTRLAANILRVPVALIAFVDSERVFFKSCMSEHEPWASLREAPLSHSFCCQVVAAGEPLVVADARQHPLLRDSPAILEFGVVAYAGIPLVTSDGYALGSLCAIDSVPRAWSEDDIAILSDLADAAMTEIELRRDLIGRNSAEQALRESEARKASMLEVALDGIITIDSQDRIVEFNPAAEKIFGYSQAEAIGKDIADLIMPMSMRDKHRRGMIRYLGTLDSKLIGTRFETSAIRADGAEFPIELGITYIHTDGSPLFTGYIRDITERKRAEAALAEAYTRLASMSEQLRASRDLLRTLFDGLDDGILLLDREGCVLEINQAAASLFACDSPAIVAERWATLCDQDQLPGQFVLQTLHDGRPRRRREHYTSPDQRYIVDVQALPLVGTTGEVEQVIIHIVNVTERLEFEALAMQSARLAASGKLAATIAHELNTPLQSVKSCLYLAGNAGEAQRENYLSLAREELDRISAILRQMLNLHRPEIGALVSIDFNLLIERVLLLTGRTLAEHDIVVETDLLPNPPPLWGRADQLTQVLLNLILNAIDAMPEGGRLLLRTKLRDLALVFTLADTGSGMRAEELTHIFDPFYTTKAEGSGLGLSISQKIVMQHGGQIYAHSEPHSGSTFTVVFPLGDEAKHE